MYSFQPRCISPLYCLVGLGKKWGLIFSGAPAPLLSYMFIDIFIVIVIYFVATVIVIVIHSCCCWITKQVLISYGGSTPLRWTTVLANVVLLFLLIIFVCCNVFLYKEKKWAWIDFHWRTSPPLAPAGSHVSYCSGLEGSHVGLPENDDDGVLCCEFTNHCLV